jgi:hypothetical protein
MSCQICFNPYDHSLYKPYTLTCQLHTFCISCIGRFNERKCPVCNKSFKKIFPNLALLEVIPESNYDKLKSESFKILNELNEMKNNFTNKRDEKLNKYLKQISEIKDAINNEANNLVKLVKVNQEKLIKEANSIEMNLKQNFSLKTIIDENQTKINLEHNNFYEEQLSLLIKEITESKINMEKTSSFIENFKENYKFNLTESLNLNELFVIGEIKTNKKVK